MKVSWRCIDSDASFFCFNIINIHIRFQQLFKDAVGIVTRKDNHAFIIKKIRYRAASSHITAIFTKSSTNIGCSPIDIWSQGIDNQHRAVWPKSFIAAFGKGFVSVSFCFIDGLVNDMLRHLSLLSSVNNEFQSCVRLWIWITFFSCYIDFHTKLSIYFWVRAVFGRFLCHNIGPFTSHWRFSFW